MFTASHSLAAAAGAAAASPLCQRLGRRAGILAGVLSFAAGEVALAASKRAAAAWSGRVLTGLGVGVMSQATYLEIVEAAEAGARGRLACTVSVCRGLGLLCAGLLSYGFGTAYGGEGWRYMHVW